MMETNGEVVDDTHLGEKGHHIQFQLFYDYLKKYVDTVVKEERETIINNINYYLNI